MQQKLNKNYSFIAKENDKGITVYLIRNDTTGILTNETEDKMIALRDYVLIRVQEKMGKRKYVSESAQKTLAANIWSRLVAMGLCDEVPDDDFIFPEEWKKKNREIAKQENKPLTPEGYGIESGNSQHSDLVMDENTMVGYFQRRDADGYFTYQVALVQRGKNHGIIIPYMETRDKNTAVGTQMKLEIMIHKRLYGDLPKSGIASDPEL